MRPEDLADELERVSQEAREYESFDASKALDWAARLLREAMRWRPVEEGLPVERDRRYLVYERDDVGFAYLDSDGTWWRLGNWLFGVTHWRPMPKGPG